MSVKLRLTIMNFLQFAVWGSYLTSMGTYLAGAGMASNIGLFYAMQGIVSLFMPALIGIIADRWIEAQRLLGICHGLAAAFMLGAGYYAMTAGDAVAFGPLFTMYALSVAFYMPTIALANSVAYSALEKSGLDPVRAFPPIRVWGTVGFICAMLLCDFAGFQTGYMQFIQCAAIGFIFAVYAFTLPQCPVSTGSEKRGVVDMLGLRAFSLFRDKRMAIFFIFSMLLGVSLQITNGFANPFLTAYRDIPEYMSTFGANHANALISLSQISETLCILLIPFFMKRYGIKRVMVISMLAWVGRFGLFGLGNPGGGVWMFVLSMLVYGVAFDFFNISGSLFVNEQTNVDIRSSAQGLFMMMTNGIGATIGTLGAQAVVNHFVYDKGLQGVEMIAGWQASWLVFAAYALVVTILFAIFFRYKYDPNAARHKM